jgi:transketolase
MRNAVRLSALMKLRVFYQFTHDSVWLGEDGPTHQPVEHIASLRAMPNLMVMRPCDENELKGCWVEALRQTDGPVAFILSRQNIKGTSDATRDKARAGVARGAYIIAGEAGEACDALLIATGSEVADALGAAKLIEAQGKKVRVVSMPCWELFEKQSAEYQASVLGGPVGLRVSIEAGVEQGWHKWIGSDGLAIAINTFGLSAPLADLRKEFGFTPEQIADRVLKALPVSA